MGAAALGVRNLLILTGDDPKAGDQPETKAVFDVDSTTLTVTARDLRDKGELPSGRKVAGTAHFFLGAADAPIDPPPPVTKTRFPAMSRRTANTRPCNSRGVWICQNPGSQAGCLTRPSTSKTRSPSA